jgi:hypothetical protein
MSTIEETTDRIWRWKWRCRGIRRTRWREVTARKEVLVMRRAWGYKRFDRVGERIGQDVNYGSSLFQICLPKATSEGRRAERLARQLFQS